LHDKIAREKLQV